MVVGVEWALALLGITPADWPRSPPRGDLMLLATDEALPGATATRLDGGLNIEVCLGCRENE